MTKLNIDLATVAAACGQRLVYVHCLADNSWLNGYADRVVFGTNKDDALALPESVAIEQFGKDDPVYKLVPVDAGDVGVPFKVTRGYALEALLQQLTKWQHHGSQLLSFYSLADHPETDEGCTLGDLIAPAVTELDELKKQNSTLVIALTNLLHQVGGIGRAFIEGQQALKEVTQK